MAVLSVIAEKIQRSSRIVVLTGAGISTGSGIPDFRSAHGLYSNSYAPQYLLSESFFQKDSIAFWKNYRTVFDIRSLLSAAPNNAHHFLSSLESLGKEVVVFTQNIDGLHQKSGSHKVYELHGSTHRLTCLVCRHSYAMSDYLNEPIPRCPHDHSVLKPDITLFDGAVKHMEKAYELVSSADLFIAMGTSLQVYPANQIPSYVANARLIFKIIINNESTSKDHLFDCIVREEIFEFIRNLNRAMKFH